MESSGAGKPKGMIRHRETGQYYRGEGKWTLNRHEAMQFDNLSLAVTEAQRHGLEDCAEFVVELNGKIGFRVLLPL
jgi:hypothetical protein